MLATTLQKATTSPIRLTLPRLHKSQAEIYRGWKRFNVAVCGRRFGKDILDRDVAIRSVLDGHPVGWWEPSYRSLMDNWRMIRGLLSPLIKQVSQQEHIMDLVTGGTLEMWSADNIDSGRGRKYKRVIINEAGVIRNLDYLWYDVIRPTLSDLQGDAILSGTPKGLNYFHTLFCMEDKSPEWASFNYPTWKNPYILKSEIESMRADLPSRVFKQEIEAQFISDGAYFQRIDDAAVIDQPDQPEQHKDHTLYMGVDWAKSEDYSVYTVACRQCNRVVDWDRFNQIDFTYQREKLYAMADRWHIAGCLPERNSIGEPNIEIIRERVNILPGLDDKPGWFTSGTTKPLLIEGLATALEHDGFKVPKEAAHELRTFEIETTASGNSKFSAPSGFHDDWVISLSLVWQAIATANRLWFIS